jgi:molybdopterin-guanine dinucleotide biosynthesis protein
MFAMTKTLAVGGHSRNTGKTSLVVDIIRATREFNWTAVKITQYGHGICAAHAHPCDCAPSDHGFALDQETRSDTGTDSSRFLAAGARRSFWLRTQQGRLAEALPRVREALDYSGHLILESNSILRFLRPDCYMVVLEPGNADFKESLRTHISRADALVLRSDWKNREETLAEWGVPPRLLEGKVCFLHPLETPLPAELMALIRQRMLYGKVEREEPFPHLSS